MTEEIERAIGQGRDMSEQDVRFIKTALNRLGFYTPDFNKGIIGEDESEFFESIKRFQRHNRLFVDGQVFPDDKMMKVLNRELKNPDNYMIFKGTYVWRIVGDKKTRNTHAAREGRQFRWDDPPEGGHPGEDFGCRCWAEPIVPMTPKGLRVGLSDLLTAAELDAINKSVSPLDVLGVGVAVVKGGRVLLTNSIVRENGKLVFKITREFVGSSARVLTSRFRDTKWIDKTPRRQMQKKFDAHKSVFNIKGNQNNKNLEAYRKALKKHIKNKDTIVIKGTYNKVEKMIHYYNPKTKINVMKDMKGEFRSVWKLKDKQQFHLLKDKNIGGGPK